MANLAELTTSSCGAVDAQRYKYGVHIEEEDSPGYLLIQSLARGSFGIASLVLSMTDGEVYVVKHDIHPCEPTQHEIQAPEVRNYIDHPNIPKLISSVEYGVRDSYKDVIEGTKTQSVWQFCNGGTFGSMMTKLFNVSKNSLLKLDYPEVEPRLPELFVWRFVESLLSVLVRIHLEGICHFDLHDGNIYLHWPTPESTVPEVFVGDFGESREYPWLDHPNRRLKVPFALDSFESLETPKFGSHLRSFCTNTQRSRSSGAEPEFIKTSLHDWYMDCQHDIHRACLHSMSTILDFPGAQVVSVKGVLHARGAEKGVNGFSIKLVRLLSDLHDLVQKSHHVFKPSAVMEQLLYLHRQAKVARKDEEARHAADVNKQKVNIMQLIRPRLPEPRPAVWPNYNCVAANGPTAACFRVPNHPTSPIWIDCGRFQIRRIELSEETKLWRVVEYNEYTDDEATPVDLATEANTDEYRSKLKTRPRPLDLTASTKSRVSLPAESSPAEEEFHDCREYPLASPNPLTDTDRPSSQPKHINFAERLRKRRLRCRLANGDVEHNNIIESEQRDLKRRRTGSLEMSRSRRRMSRSRMRQASRVTPKMNSMHEVEFVLEGLVRKLSIRDDRDTEQQQQKEEKEDQEQEEVVVVEAKRNVLTDEEFDVKMKTGSSSEESDGEKEGEGEIVQFTFRV